MVILTFCKKTNVTQLFVTVVNYIPKKLTYNYERKQRNEFLIQTVQ